MFANAYVNEKSLNAAVLEYSYRGKTGFVPLRQTKWSGEIYGPIIAADVIHTFRLDDHCKDTLEAVYRFPLPGDAAVTGVTVWFGDTEIEAVLKKRNLAEKDYQTAVKSGHKAALLTRESPDVFTLNVAGIQTQQDVRIQTSYVQFASNLESGWSLRIPLTVASRFVRHDESSSRHSKGQPLAVFRDPGHRFSLDLTIFGNADVVCTTHELVTKYDHDEVHVSLASGEIIPDRDLVLSWKQVGQETNTNLKVYLQQNSGEPDAYFLATIRPPLVEYNTPTLPKEIILLVDHSGSMDGKKRSAADTVAASFIQSLEDQDRFNIGFFQNDVDWFSEVPLEATKKVKLNVQKFINERMDNGGTELGKALEQACFMDRASGQYARHILLITDAEVIDFSRILTVADQEATRKDARYISVIAIDSAPNATLVNELARRGRGAAHFLPSTPSLQEMTAALASILEEWKGFIAEGVSLSAKGLSIILPDGITTTQGAALIGDISSRRTRSICGKIPGCYNESIEFSLTDINGDQIGSYTYVNKNITSPAIRALFSAQRINALEYLKENVNITQEYLANRLAAIGYNQVDIDELNLLYQLSYSENRNEIRKKFVSNLIAAESLAAGVPSSETSFIAIHREAGNEVTRNVTIGNAVPDGWDLSPRYRPHIPLNSFVNFNKPLLDEDNSSLREELFEFAAPERSVAETSKIYAENDLLLERVCRRASLPSKDKQAGESLPVLPILDTPVDSRLISTRRDRTIPMKAEYRIALYSGKASFINDQYVLYSTRFDNDRFRLIGTYIKGITFLLQTDKDFPGPAAWNDILLTGARLVLRTDAEPSETFIPNTLNIQDNQIEFEINRIPKKHFMFVFEGNDAFLKTLHNYSFSLKITVERTIR